MDTQYLPVRDVALALKVPLVTIDLWIGAGQLHVELLQGQLMIRTSEVQWLNQNVNPPTNTNRFH